MRHEVAGKGLTTTAPYQRPGGAVVLRTAQRSVLISRCNPRDAQVTPLAQPGRSTEQVTTGISVPLDRSLPNSGSG
jgi:hypothetical protein